jgi:membrane-bound ClpP family serine protease
MSDDILIQRLLRYQHPTMDDAARRITELKEENERRREALEKIAQYDMQAVAMDALQPGERIRTGDKQ